MKLLTSIFAMTLLLLTACSDDEENPTNGDGDNQPVTYQSEETAVGDGNAHTWVTVDADGVPTEFGVWIDDAALEGLPAADELPEQMPFKDYHLHLPEDSDFTNLLGVQSIHLDWNPEGHEPPGTFDVPHFDLHFYVISDEIRNTIASDDTNKYIDPRYIPEGYELPPDTTIIPRMGIHAGEYVEPGTFTRTYIYGYYDGAMAFFEPMFTVDYLNSNPDNESFELKVPEAFTYNGYAPQKITYHYDSENGGWNITLSDLMAVTDDTE